jgi:hypothetical protein
MIKELDNPEKALDNLRHHRPVQEFIKEGDEIFHAHIIIIKLIQ